MAVDILYQVKAGETLKSIALSRLNDAERWKEIAHVNSLSHPYMVTPGQLILVPSSDDPVSVVIEPSDRSAPAEKAINSLSPAQWGLIAGGAAFLWWWLK